MSRKSELKQPDQVQAAIERGLGAAFDNRKPILISFAVLVVGLMVVVGVRHDHNRTLEQRNLILSLAARELQQAKAMDDQSKKEEALMDVMEDLNGLYEQTLGTDLHPFVLTQIADVMVAQGKYADAIGSVNEIIAIDDIDPYLRNAAMYRLTKLQVAQQKRTDGAATAQQGLEETDGPFNPLLKTELERLSTASLNEDLTRQLRNRQNEAQQAQ